MLGRAAQARTARPRGTGWSRAVDRGPRGLEPALRDLGIRGDIIENDAPGGERDENREPDLASLDRFHGDQAAEPVLGRLVERGLHDELKGTAYAIIEGVDGRTHHVVSSDLKMTDDAKPGAIVETRTFDDAGGRKRLTLATRSDLTVDAQVSAPAPPGSTVGFSPGVRAQRQRLRCRRPGGNGPPDRSSRQQDQLDGRASASSSLAISSIRFAGASSMRPPPNCRPTRGSPIVHPRKASTSRAFIASASRSRRGGSL